jgi:hypothetical protein
MFRVQTILKSNEGRKVTIKDPTTKKPTFGGHSFERVGNCLCFSLHVQAIADFKSQKYEEAKGLKACTPEAEMDVAIDHQSEDTGSVAMGFRQNCEGKEENACDACERGIFK